MERRKPGRPSKGDRRSITLRFPRTLIDTAQQLAAARGVPFNDLVCELLAAEVRRAYRTREVVIRRSA